MSDINDATPFNVAWDQWTCWDAIAEILMFMIWWLNPPWGKNQQFMPWAFEQFFFHGASFLVLVDENCFNLAFNRQWLHPLFKLIDDLPKDIDVDKVNFLRVHKKDHKRTIRALKHGYKGEELKRLIA